METKLYLAEGKRGIWTVAGAELLGKRTLSVDGLSLASRAAELADKVMPSSEPNQVIYELFADFLKNLEVSEHPKTLLFEYELHLLAESGFRPVTDRCAVCSKGLEGKLVFSPGHGGVVHVGCLRGGEQAFPITAQAAGLLVPGADSLELEAALPELRKIWDHYLAYVLSHSFRSDKFIQSLSAISEAHERT
jgi:DNA repair protein RecO (recombination protein O)